MKAESNAKSSDEGSRDTSITETADNKSQNSGNITTNEEYLEQNTSPDDFTSTNGLPKPTPRSCTTKVSLRNTSSKLEKLKTYLTLMEENIKNTLSQMKDEFSVNLECVQSNITKIGKESMAQIENFASNLTSMEENIHNILKQMKNGATVNLERLQSNITEGGMENVTQFEKLATYLTSMEENINNILLQMKDQANVNLEHVQSNITEIRKENMAQIEKLSANLTSMKENINDIILQSTVLS